MNSKDLEDQLREDQERLLEADLLAKLRLTPEERVLEHESALELKRIKALAR